ncbi:increased DNA methylation 1-like [Cucurbita moschata]|uniref:Increased DNA methylation 1-like n=1 Tax=Cucurbita moschata TaxID=3662 RepID=A0A6J1H3J7_CUCMO|nr:increased DNA methylation 1-like [Cucurbita moschata]
MEDGVRSGGPSGVLVKTRNSSGCLIVRKKEDGFGGAGASGSRLVNAKKEKKRPRLVLSDSGSSDELLLPHRRRVGPETIRVCNGLNSFGKDVMDESGSIRKKDRLQYVKRNDDDLINRMDVDGLRRNVETLEVFDFNEYDEIDGETRRRKIFNDSGGQFLGSMKLPRSGIDREFGTASSRHALVDKRKNLYAEQTDCFDRDRPPRKISFESDNDGPHLPTSLLRDKFRGHSEEAIRVQGKNGVLKVLVNKKKNVSGSSEMYDHCKLEEGRRSRRTEDTLKSKVTVTPSVYPETKLNVKQDPFSKPEKDRTDFQTPSSTKNIKGCSWDSGDSSVSLKPRKKVVEAHKSTKRASCEVEKLPCEETPPSTAKEGKIKRGSGTEKQKLRERIRGMLLSAGWKIDYRPRRNRDYLDAVYVNPSGTAYWSIIKAYDALQKQLNEEGAEAKPSADGSFTPISDDILSQLTRKTRKKIENEWKNKQRDDSDSENAREASALRSAGTKNDMDSMDSDSNEEKLSTFVKQGGKSCKNKLNENGCPSVNSKGQSSGKYSRDTTVKSSSGSNSRILHGRRGRKLGLLVRGSNRGLDSENDGFVPYTGKRTLLSWLIDSGTVQLSQKVRYMNRRQTRVMLEGWITRDGIHCGCCSKILTVSKFEIHAGSKLRQPFQNIFLESGVSLLQCQRDAWNRQEESKRLSFHTVEVDGDDPNDDTCGICGDGGDLICCDGCPSTFHQSCLDIQIPPGDWHCPNCTCKYCGVANVDISQGENTIVPEISTCVLCEKKFHESCSAEMDTPVQSNGSVTSFCGKNCRELFENLQKYLGVKHELDAGFSWSLIRRTNEDPDVSVRGLSQRIECNSKLAVALTVMDECFLPIVDRRSGINLIHNVLYNCGSNFYRLNYSGFYTAILERGDEIISAATIRFHGTKLAEMPFIGTRHIYRRQGMCRRLFCAIESALRTLKVEKLIIPAIAELMHTWNVIFGFSSLEPSLKQEMRLMNMLVFPGTDMLQKLLIQESIVEENPSTGSGAKRTDCRSTEFSSPKIDTETSSGHEPRSCDDTEQHHFKAKTNEVAVTNLNPESVSVSLNDTSTANSPLDAFCEAKTPCSPMQTVTSDSDSDDKPGIRHGLEDRSQSTSQCMAADTSLNNFLEPKVKVSNEGIICSNAHAGHKLADSVYVRKSFSPTTGNGTFELENNIPVMDSPEDDAHANSLKPTRPFETTSDCKNAIAYVKEAISDGICGSESSPQSCGAKARGGLQEERAESGSV